MSGFNDLIKKLKTVDYYEKKQILEYLIHVAANNKHQFSKEDKDTLLSYAYEEVGNMLKVIPETANYKEKDLIFSCENFLVDLIMQLCGSPAMLPPDELLKIKELTELIDKERYIETTLDAIFEQTAITDIDVNRLLYWVRQSNDEYQRSMLFLGLLHYMNGISKMDTAAENVMADYISEEIRRLIACDGEDAWNTLELIADVSKYFMRDNVISALQDLIKLGRNHINVYAVATLCSRGLDIPQSVIEALAGDLEYADTTYRTLQSYGKANLFPPECVTEEYLAKSDLVRWLTYPTELGKAPDEIVYIGKIKQLLKKEVFHVFKYRSDSEQLGDGLKNKWLVGWSSNEGGTFSNFDEFAPYEQGTTEKTLKLIKKTLLG